MPSSALRRAAFGFDLKELETLWQDVEREKGRP
jgi:hypothetical protein